MYRETGFVLHDLVLLAGGLQWTIGVFAASFALGSLLGFVLALIRHARLPVLRQIVGLFVQLFRNTPLLVQLFLVFYGLPMATSLSPSAAEAAIWTLSINTAAFTVVNVESALEAVPRGQWQAARSFGMSWTRIMRSVILPQALRTAIPPTITLAVGQLQVTSLVAIIGVADLTRMGVIVNTRTLSPFAVWPIVGLVYFVLSKALSILADRMERRMRARITWFAAAT